LNTIAISSIVFACIFGASLLGMLLRRVLPQHHLSTETKDSVKLAMGLVATMVALVLGLLIAAAKDKYDKESAGVTQMAAKVIFLDRMLANYGPETKEVRELLKQMVERVANSMWPDQPSTDSQLDPSASRTETIYAAAQALAPQNDFQSTLKSQALSKVFDLGQMRWQEFEQANSALSVPLLCILTFWLAILFISFGLFAPSNGTVVVALFTAALAVAGAIFLMLELNSPFSGMLQIPRTAFDDAVAHLGK
jgi:Protein of unknown function (DUF4239)